MAQSPRVIFLGDPAVGKTSLITRIQTNQFHPMTLSTTATASFNYFPDGEDSDFCLSLWDTAGMEQYKSMNRIYYRDAVAAILVFDFTSRATFAALNAWRDDFASCAVPNAVIIVAGNKYDLEGEFEVSEEEARWWAEEANVLFFPTSAATGEGVSELLDGLVRTVPRVRVIDKTQVVSISRRERGQPARGVCC